MVVLVTCKKEEDPFKMKALEWAQHFSHCKSKGIFSEAQGQLTPLSVVRYCRNSNSSELLMVVLVTCKNKDGAIKNEGTRVLTSFIR